MNSEIDEVRLRELLEQSDDLNSDVMRRTRSGLDDYVEVSRGQHRSWTPALAIGAAAGAAAMLATAGQAWGQANTDVQALQTAASLENLAVATYQTALTLPFIGGAAANAVVKAFAEKTMAQHGEHAKAFNAALTQMGSPTQNEPNPKYAPVVQQAVPTIMGPEDVVNLAVTLENVATQTYVKNVSQVSTKELRQLFGSVASVEAQHQAVLLAVQALLKGGAPELIALPPDAAALPDAAGSVGFPNGFIPTDMASPVEEGAVK